MCMCSVIVWVLNCLYNIIQWKHLVIVTMPRGLRRGQRMRVAWFVFGLLCGNMRVSLFLCKNLQHLTKGKSLQLHDCHAISHSMSKQSFVIQHKIRLVGNVRTPAANSEGQAASGMRNESGGWGSYLWRRWRRGVRPRGHWSLGSRERSWTVPGGHGPSTDRPAAWSTQLH